MTRRPRRNHSPAFKAKVAVAVIRGEQMLVELSQQFDVHANQIKQWKDQLLEGATGVFGDEAKAEPAVQPSMSKHCTPGDKLRLR
ncbi:transposase [Rhizobium herbae]|uniref:Transposase n=1 Tax=Rhizobium herbae TaxID=508661 RepID=A0ABS4EVM1_9HYPH|nr:transposase [Rhizobium herbae]MBP1862009.1 transposase [Rhizobium herbae]